MKIIILISISLGGIMVGWIIKWLRAKLMYATAERIARKKTEDALKAVQQTKEEILVEGREQLKNERQQIIEEFEENLDELNELKKNVYKRNETVSDRDASLQRLKQAVENRENTIEQLKNQNQNFKEELRQELEKKSGTSRSTLKELQVKAIINEEKRDAGNVLTRMEEDFNRGAESKAKEILISSMERLPVTQVVQNNPVNHEVPNQDTLMRLIAREGRFIRLLESLLEVEIVVGDSAEPLNMSSPDPIKREMARAVLDRLFKQGRVYPDKIREAVRSVKREADRTMIEEAEAVLRDLKIRDFSSDAKRALGRLLYRYSYGQNQLYHSKEASLLATMLASELRCNTDIAKRGALLHDVGKGSSQDDKTHVEIGVEMAEKWGEDPKVINAIAAHHGDTEQESAEASVVQIAESISSARPGARRETISSYLERVEKLEGIATSFHGVDTAFTLYAGRELRI